MRHAVSPYEDLANAIVVQAVEDYRNAREGIGSKRYPPKVVIREVERFFRSDWFLMLTRLDGEVLLEKLRNEFK